MDEYDYGWKPQRQNPSSMSSSSGNQSIGGMPMPMTTERTLYPSQPEIHTNLTAPYPTQSTPYPLNSLPYPNHQTAPFLSYPGQPLSQQADPPSFNPSYDVQPTAPPACSESTKEYIHAPPTNYHTSASSDRIPSSGKNKQIVLKSTPMVLRFLNFIAAIGDARALRKAMKGSQTNKRAIISILSYRNNLHRQNIAKSYKALYGKNLMQDLKSEIFKFHGFKFEDLIVAMMTPIVDYYVKEIHDSISGTDADKDVLIMILCTLKNQDIHQIRARYDEIYGKSLESDISGDNPGRFERLMMSLCRGERDESALTDIDAAKIDAKKLHGAEVGLLGTNESAFNSILIHRNIHQLRLVFQEYSKLYGHDISQKINRELSGHVKTAVSTIVKVAKNSASYFAEQLNDAMSGKKTRDQKLIFICVTRSEIDMGDIKKAFLKKYKNALEKQISKNTSGNYNKCLTELISLNFKDERPIYISIFFFLVAVILIKLGCNFFWKLIEF